MKYTLFQNITNPNGTTYESSFEDLVQLLTTHDIKINKDGQLYSPAIYNQDKVYRSNQYVQYLSAIVLDFDNEDKFKNPIEHPYLPEHLPNELKKYSYIYYSTHSSSLQNPKWRLVVPLRKEIAVKDFKLCREGLIYLLGNPVGLDYSCKDASRAYYTPSCQIPELAFSGYAHNEYMPITRLMYLGKQASKLSEEKVKESYVGRHDQLSAYLGGMFNDGLSDDEAALKLLERDRVFNPNNPLFEDLSESDMNSNDPYENSLNFVVNHRQSMNARRESEGLAPIISGELQDGDTFPVTRFHDLTLSSECLDFVHNVLTYNGMSVIYGDSNVGKSFLAIDLCLSIAQGKPWHGVKTEKGGVLYVAAEGGRVFQNRLLAYKKYHNLNGDLPFSYISTNVSFKKSTEVMKLARTVQSEVQKYSDDILIIVIDTLARAIDGGNENSSQDMGLLVTLSDALREWTGAHVMFIHHTGKDKARGARGHSSLRAATDTEIELERIEGAEDITSVTVTKQRDLPAISLNPFSLKQVILGKNDRGDDITSCILVSDGVDSRKDSLSSERAKLLHTIIQNIVSNKVLSNSLLISKKLGVVEFDYTTLFTEFVKISKTNVEDQDKEFSKAVNELIKHNYMSQSDNNEILIYFMSSEAYKLYHRGL